MGFDQKLGWHVTMLNRPPLLSNFHLSLGVNQRTGGFTSQCRTMWTIDTRRNTSSRSQKIEFGRKLSWHVTMPK